MICKMEVLRYNTPCENVSRWFNSEEIDVLAINKSDYLTEYEVKISRSDFKADAKKSKWIWYLGATESLTPNYFYYVCPQGLILKEELPKFAGLIYATSEGLQTIKKAPQIHKKSANRFNVLKKFCRIITERTYLGCCRLTYENRIRMS